jgi:hypothetical protein
MAKTSQQEYKYLIYFLREEFFLKIYPVEKIITHKN